MGGRTAKCVSSSWVDLCHCEIDLSADERQTTPPALLEVPIIYGDIVKLCKIAFAWRHGVRARARACVHNTDDRPMVRTPSTM